MGVSGHCSLNNVRVGIKIVFVIPSGCILRLPIWGDAADDNCFDDEPYWEVRDEALQLRRGFAQIMICWDEFRNIFFPLDLWLINSTNQLLRSNLLIGDFSDLSRTIRSDEKLQVGLWCIARDTVFVLYRHSVSDFDLQERYAQFVMLFLLSNIILPRVADPVVVFTLGEWSTIILPPLFTKKHLLIFHLVTLSSARSFILLVDDVCYSRSSDSFC